MASKDNKQDLCFYFFLHNLQYQKPWLTTIITKTMVSTTSTTMMVLQTIIATIMPITIIKTHNDGRISSTFGHNNLKCLTNTFRPPRNQMKTSLISTPCVNHFTWVNHDDPFTHLVKFDQISGSVEVSDYDEEVVFLWMFPHPLIGKSKCMYVNQNFKIMKDWNAL